MSDDQVWSRSAEVLLRELEGETVLYVPSTDGVVTLEPIGTAVWQVLEFPGSLGEPIPPLAEAFGTTFGWCRARLMSEAGH